MKRSGRDVLFSLAGGLALVVGILAVGSLLGGSGDGSPASDDTLAVSPDDAAAVGPSPAAAPVSSSTPESAPSSSTTPPTPTTAAAMPFTGDGGMSISALQSTEPELWETANGECSSNPQTAVIAATVLAPSGLADIGLGWGVDAPEVEWDWVEMQQTAPDVYSVTIGPFDADTLESGDIEPILVQIEAVDVDGNVALADPEPFVVLYDCETG